MLCYTTIRSLILKYVGFLVQNEMQYKGLMIFSCSPLPYHCSVKLKTSYHAKRLAPKRKDTKAFKPAQNKVKTISYQKHLRSVVAFEQWQLAFKLQNGPKQNRRAQEENM